MTDFIDGKSNTVCEILLMGLGLDIQKTPILNVLKLALEEEPATATEFFVSVRNIAEQHGMSICRLGANPGTNLDWQCELEYVKSLLES